MSELQENIERWCDERIKSLIWKKNVTTEHEENRTMNQALKIKQMKNKRSQHQKSNGKRMDFWLTGWICMINASVSHRAREYW